MQLSINKNGFTIPLVTVFVALFISIPVLVLVFSSKSSKENVMGANTTVVNRDETQFVKVHSTLGTWDLFVYLCDDKSACSKSLTSGKRSTTISGGAAVDHVVKVSKDDSWSSYKFLKVYIKPGWGSQKRSFAALVSGDGYEVIKIDLDGSENNVVIVALDKINDTGFSEITFKDD